jgi:RNA polymerase sigma factor (sigma-70 family)
MQIATHNETNTALIARCKDGDNRAFKELYDLYAKAMFNVCMRILNQRDEAEDVLQESFISAFKNLNQYNGTASFGSWLKRIVINKSLDALRKKKVNLISIDAIDYADEEINDDEVVYETETLRKAIQQLPDGYRIILSLFLFEDLTHKAIAQKLNISEGTSKSQYARARKKLQELIQPAGSSIQQVKLKNKRNEQ